MQAFWSPLQHTLLPAPRLACVGSPLLPALSWGQQWGVPVGAQREERAVQAFILPSSLLFLLVSPCLSPRVTASQPSLSSST